MEHIPIITDQLCTMFPDLDRTGLQANVQQRILTLLDLDSEVDEFAEAVLNACIDDALCGIAEGGDRGEFSIDLDNCHLLDYVSLIP